MRIRRALLVLALFSASAVPAAAQCVDDGDCDDGLACTVDRCAPELGRCTNLPNDALCDQAAACVTGVCGAPAAVGPGQWVQAGAPGSGCSLIMDDGFCTDTWDGCACNGAERCVGAGSADPSGCAGVDTLPALRAGLPCEGSAVGDGDACTEENCCEPWDPDGCRLHRLAEAAADRAGRTPPLLDFCEAVADDRDHVVVSTPLGRVQCVSGDRAYTIPAVDPVLGDPLPFVKPSGYWCEDCNPCSEDLCQAATGLCNNPPRPNGTVVPAPDLGLAAPWLALLPPRCVTEQSCEGVTNFGCARRVCIANACRNGPNPANPDQTRSETCQGFPAGEYDEAIPSLAFGTGATTCFELQCQNLASRQLPDFDCVALPHDDLCDNGLFCDGPGRCDRGEICGDCSPAELAALLQQGATFRSASPPTATGRIAGCAALTPGEVCADGVDCTVDRCRESDDACENVADERFCAEREEQDWSPCEPGYRCLAEEGCQSLDDPCVSESGCAMRCLDGGEGLRQCVTDSETCDTDECYAEGYMTLELADLTDLCPFHPDDTVPRGDRDFDGHGPDVAVDVLLEVGADRRSIVAIVRFTAQETTRDFSTIDFVFPPRVVATSPFEILGIVSQTTGRARGLSAPGGTVGFACGDCGVVTFATVEGVITDVKARGDTPDDDISHDPDCSEDTVLLGLELSTVEVFFRDDCSLI